MEKQQELTLNDWFQDILSRFETRPLKLLIKVEEKDGKDYYLLEALGFDNDGLALVRNFDIPDKNSLVG